MPFLPLVFSRTDAAEYGDTWDDRVIVVSLDYAGRIERIPNGSTNVLFVGGGDLIDPRNEQMEYPAAAEILTPHGVGQAP